MKEKQIMEKETRKEIEEKAKTVIRAAKQAKIEYEKVSTTSFPIKDFVDQVLEKEPYSNFSQKVKNKAKEFVKYL